MSTSTSWLAAIAAHGLPGAQRSAPASPLAKREWDTLWSRVIHERLSGLLLAAVEDGAVSVTSEQFDELLSHHERTLNTALHLERHLLLLVDDLEARGVSHSVVKGPAIAHTAYNDPSLRLFGDLDVLVAADRLGEVKELLLAQGAQRVWPELRRGFDQRFGKGVAYRMPDGAEIDVHRSLASGYYGLAMEPDLLLRRATTFPLASRAVCTLRPEHHLLHACYHATTGHVVRLSTLRDIAQLVLVREVPPDPVLELATEWDALPLVAQAVRITWQTFALADVVELSAWAHRHRPTPRERRLLATYMGPHNSEARRALTSLRAIPGLGQKTAFLRSILLPDSHYLQFAGRGRLAWLRRVTRAIPRPVTDDT